ncbi:MAG: hypothetical protein E7585_05980 [Ruminococcaceae bacterium]|nr:hypothetical protein [Oscillospiraceae bacterium]
MYISLIAEILLAVFAVFGLYAMIRLFVTAHLFPAAIYITVELRWGIEAEDLPLLLDRARERLFFCGSDRLLAMVDPRLSENTALLAALREAGVPYFFKE